jgi:hypothetical protein
VKDFEVSRASACPTLEVGGEETKEVQDIADGQEQSGRINPDFTATRAKHKV